MHRHDSSLHNGGERATSLAFCRDTITRIADKGHLQRAHIETLLSERVRNLKFFIWLLTIKSFRIITYGIFSWQVCRITFQLIFQVWHQLKNNEKIVEQRSRNVLF